MFSTNYFLKFQPENGGEILQFDTHSFKIGSFNHFKLGDKKLIYIYIHCICIYIYRYCF